ncbi:MAG: hypothetical protein ACM3XZ_07580 [Betaproteobacteria bacterium]
MSHLGLDCLRKEVEAHQSELNREYYLNFSGQKPDFDLSGIYARHGWVFSRPQLDAVREELERAERQLDTYDGEVYGAAGDEAKRLRFLYQFLVEGHLAERVKELDEELTAEEARTVVRVEGEEIPFRQLTVRMGNTPDRAKRARLEAARVEEIERRNPARLERWRTLHAAARELGYADYATLCAESRGINLIQLGEQMEGLLDETDDVYHQSMALAWRSAHGRGLAGAESHDLSRFWRAPQFDTYFSAGRVVEALHRSLAGLGIALPEQKNIIVDAAERPAKAPRAFCAPVRVPDEVYLNILPQGGPHDYEAILHEAGHAEHFGLTDRHRPMEYRWLGDYSVTEAYATALEHLLMEEEWLREVIGMPSDVAAAFRRFMLLRKLFFVRRYTAKLQYELDLHRSAEPALQRETYTAFLLRATFVHYPSALFLSDLDDAFYAANYIRAWLLEAQLKEEIRRRFGRRWFAQKGAGDFLRELWHYGGELTAEEVAEQIGCPGLETGPLAEEFRTGLA